MISFLISIYNHANELEIKGVIYSDDTLESSHIFGPVNLDV